MSNKTVDINPNPRGKPHTDTAALDSFVQGKKQPPLSVVKEPMKRLTFDIPAGLHKRIRLTCLKQDEEMATVLRRILVEHFPE